MWWWVRTGSHEGPIPTSTSSPAPTIYGLGGPIRRIVGASGERVRGGGPLWSPVRGLLSDRKPTLATRTALQSAEKSAMPSRKLEEP